MQKGGATWKHINVKYMVSLIRGILFHKTIKSLNMKKIDSFSEKSPNAGQGAGRARRSLRNEETRMTLFPFAEGISEKLLTGTLSHKMFLPWEK